MARKARPGLSTVLKFIAMDDDSIGGDPETLGKRYSEYIQTANHRILAVDLDKAPSYYYLRPLDTRQMQGLQGLLGELRIFMTRRLEAALAQEKGERPVTLTEDEKEREKQLDLDYQVFRESILADCLIGCDNQKIVSSVDDDGDTVYTEIRWEIGSPRPEGFLKAIKSDIMLVDNIVHFLIRAASLTEKEKKR